MARQAEIDQANIDEAIIELIIAHTTNDTLRKKALIPLITLKQLVAWSELEQLTSNWQSNEHDSTSLVNRISNASNGSKLSYSNQKFYKNQDSKSNPCRNCGGRFNKEHFTICPAKEQSCHGCGNRGHFKKFCRAKTTNYQSRERNYGNSGQNQRRVNQVYKDNEQLSPPSPQKEFYYSYTKSAYTITSQINLETPRVKLLLNGNQIEHIIDTGATVNVLSRSAYESLNVKPKLKPTNTRLKAFNTNKKLELLGEFEIELNINNKYAIASYVVLADDNEKVENLLSYQTSIRLGLITINIKQTFDTALNTQTDNKFGEYIMNKYPEVFQRGKIGLMKLDKPIHIDYDKDAKHIQQPHYKMPLHLFEPAKAKINEWLKQNIIERVEYGDNIGFISPMHPIDKTKPGSDKVEVRLTSNCKMVNKTIYNKKFVMPNVASISHELNGCEWFSKLDLNEAFLQIPIDEETRQLTTFSTPWGLFRYTRLNQGMSPCSEIFNEVLANKLRDIENIKVAIDDILAAA